MTATSRTLTPNPPKPQRLMASAAPPRGDINLAQAAQLLAENNDFLIVSHLRPDGDCLGSATGLMMGLEAMGKRVAAYNHSGVPKKLNFVPSSDRVSTKLPDWKPGLVVFVDCGGRERVHADFRPTAPTLNIDHHATNSRFGDWNYVDLDAAAVGEQVLDVLTQLGVPITRDIATSLYTSIASDTGSFRYPSTTGRTLDKGALLLKRGADAAAICQALYESRSRGELLLTGKAFANLRFECDGRFVWSELRAADYREAGGIDNEPEGLVTDMRGIEGVEVSMLLHEVEPRGIRCGLRSKSVFDCSKLAAELGGGGHRNASGYFNDHVEFEAEKKRIMEIAMRHLAEAYGA